MADRPDVAVGPEVAELTVCGRAVEIPVAGSAFPGGHRPFDGLFRVAQLPASAAAVAVAPLLCTDVAVIVEVEEPEELAEAMEEAEFCRCTVLRGPEVNILLTSSGFIAPKPLPLEVHPMRLLGWKDRGGATAVIGSRCVGEGCTRRDEVLLHFVSLPRLCCLWFTLAIPHSLPRVILFPIPMQCAIFLRVYSLWLPILNAVSRVNTGRAAVVCSCYDGCKTAVEGPNIVYEQILSNMSSLVFSRSADMASGRWSRGPSSSGLKGGLRAAAVGGTVVDSAATTTPERPMAASQPHLQLAVNAWRYRVSCGMRPRGWQSSRSGSFFLARPNQHRLCPLFFAKRVRASS